MFTAKVQVFTWYGSLLDTVEVNGAFKSKGWATRSAVKRGSEVEHLYPWSQQQNIQIYEDGVLIEG